MADVSILDQSVHAAPKQYKITGTQDIVLRSVTASFDGTGAAGSWVPCVQIIDPSGFVVGTYILGTTLATGASADVSWFPGVGVASSATASQILTSLTSYIPVGGFQTIASTNPAAADNVVTSSSFSADGVTQFRVDFGVSLVDISVTAGGTGTALLLQLVVDTTILGIVADYNVVPNLNIYGSIPVFLSVFDTPAAGSHTYSIQAYKVLTGGATATMRIYGSNAGPPFTNVTHPGYLAVSKAVLA